MRRSRYEIEISRRALDVLAHLSERERRELGALIEGLRDEPCPDGSVSLPGEPHAFRMRAGPYRIVYEVFDRDTPIAVASVSDRVSTGSPAGSGPVSAS